MMIVMMMTMITIRPHMRSSIQTYKMSHGKLPSR